MTSYQNITIIKIDNEFYDYCIEWQNGSFDSWEQKAKYLKYEFYNNQRNN